MKIAIEPFSKPEFDAAVVAAGGTITELAPDVKALIWTDYASPKLLDTTLEKNPQLAWVQLPFAGVDAFAHIISKTPIFTSAKGSYSEPVAEHALALCLALGRAIPERVSAKSWGKKFAVSLYESKVLVIGAGGIARELVSLLEPFGTEVVCLGRSEISQLNKELPTADFVVLACALTSETRHLINEETLRLMKPTAYLVNVARGPVIDTNALIYALENGVIAGAGVDVTDPEPLPDGHPLWNAPNLIITPHTADTDAQVIRMFAERIYLNVSAFVKSTDFIGVVSKELGY